MKPFILLSLWVASLGLRSQTAQDFGMEALKLKDQQRYRYAIERAKAGLALDSTAVYLHEILLESMYLSKQREPLLAWHEAYQTLLNNSFNPAMLCGISLLDYPIEPELALPHFERALTIAPNDTFFHLALFHRGTTKGLMRDFEGAALDFRNFLSFFPNDLEALINLASIEVDLGRKDSSMAFLKRVLALDPDNIPALANTGFRLQQDSAWEASNLFYNRVLELDPQQPLGYSNRSYNRMMLGDLKGAMKDINKSIELLPENSWAYRNKGLIYLRMNKKKEACAAFEEGLRRGFTERYGPELEALWRTNCP